MTSGVIEGGLSVMSGDSGCQTEGWSPGVDIRVDILVYGTETNWRVDVHLYSQIRPDTMGDWTENG